MNMKTIGIVALVGVVAVGLFAGVVAAASPSAFGTGGGMGSHGGMGGHGMMTQGGMTNGCCPMNGAGTGYRNGPQGYATCPYYPGGNCTYVDS